MENHASGNVTLNAEPQEFVGNALHDVGNTRLDKFFADRKSEFLGLHGTNTRYGGVRRAICSRQNGTPYKSIQTYKSTEVGLILSREVLMSEAV